DLGMGLAEFGAFFRDGGSFRRLTGRGRRTKLRQAAVDFREARIENVELRAQAITDGGKLFAQLGQALVGLAWVPDCLLDLVEKLLEGNQVRGQRRGCGSGRVRGRLGRLRRGGGSGRIRSRLGRLRQRGRRRECGYRDEGKRQRNCGSSQQHRLRPLL